MNILLAAQTVIPENALKWIAGNISLAGLLMFIVSLPLAMRRVPMNRWYGFRIKAAFESDERWYAVNEYGGRLLTRWSLPVIAVGIAGWFVPGSSAFAYTVAAMLVLLVGAAVPAIAVVMRERPSGHR